MEYEKDEIIKEQTEALREVLFFLGHIQARVADGAFNHIWSIVEEAYELGNEHN